MVHRYSAMSGKSKKFILRNTTGGGLALCGLQWGVAGEGGRETFQKRVRASKARFCLFCALKTVGSSLSSSVSLHGDKIVLLILEENLISQRFFCLFLIL